MKVTLRQRKKRDKISLYLDYYHKGKRSYEYLELYLHPEPEKGKLTKEQKKENKDTLALAESIRAKRHLEIKNGVYGFQDQSKVQGSFLRYMEYLAEKRKSSKGNYGNWDSTLKHLIRLAPPGTKCTLLQEKDNLIDPYGRSLAYLMLRDSSCVNELMVQQGYAKAYHKYYCSELPKYGKLNFEAKKKDKGLYSIVNTF